jgi:hypothetical protein
MAWLTADCVRKSSLAARVKLPHRAKAANAFNWRLSMVAFKNEFLSSFLQKHD